MTGTPPCPWLPSRGRRRRTVPRTPGRAGASSMEDGLASQPRSELRSVCGRMHPTRR
jgi:hypothetical protein